MGVVDIDLNFLNGVRVFFLDKEGVWVDKISLEKIKRGRRKYKILI